MPSTAAVILAAGQGRRFGGAKLLALLDGRPVLQHVLDLTTSLGLGPVVVVLGRDAAALEAACSWRAERRLRNDRPERGISSSVRLALDDLAKSDATRALLMLGDQPRLSAGQAKTILGVAPDAARPVVVPRYAGNPGNPVLLERAAWPQALELEGDRGMVQLFTRRPDLVRYVDVAGVNPDVDTPADLVALRGESVVDR